MSDPLIAARAVHFASSLLAGGSCTMAALAASRATGPELSGRQKAAALLTCVALFCAAVSGLLWLLVVSANIGAPVWIVVTETQFGQIWQIRAGLGVIVFAMAVAPLLRPRLFAPAFLVVEAAFALAFVAALAFAGHAGSGAGLPGDIHLAGDAVHLICAAVWVGGLLPLYLFVGPVHGLGAISPQKRLRLLHRFSVMAMAAVILLLLSGILNASFMLHRPAELITSPYGNFVLGKIVLLGLMLGFAAYNRFRLVPQLQAASSEITRHATVSALGRSILAELCLGVLVICAVAVLGQLPPPMH